MKSPARTAAILAIGSELLGTQRLDTNSLALTEVLERFGIELVAKSVVGDDENTLVRELAQRLDEVDLVLCTGGLGPTADDRTRAAAARALGRTRRRDPELVEHIRGLFRSFGRDMPAVNERQAEVIDGAEVLLNGRGTAPGLRLEHARSGELAAELFLFPGPPRELRGMIEDHFEPYLQRRQGDDASRVAVERRVLHVAMLPESEVEQRLAPVYERFGAESIAVLASPGQIRVELLARGLPPQRAAALEPMVVEARAAIGGGVFAEGPHATLEAATGEALSAVGATAVTAESCTGGLIAQRLTAVPGSSAFFLGGVVSYSNELKTRLLGVEESLLAEHGAVSEPVARAMAIGARSRLGADLAVAVTGIAGPGGGSEHKPVGTVHLALAGPADGQVEHRRVRFPGDRERVRQMTSQLALDLVRRRASIAT